MLAPLPCPFCGHEAEAGRVGWTDRYAVVCGNPDGCAVEAQATAGSTDEAVELWNKRAPAEVAARYAA